MQAIGGANQKIEGFYDVCRLRGLTGEQGVIIPASNVQHLMLREDVVQAVDEGKFAVHAVSTIDEALELLTGVPAGEPGEDGTLPAGLDQRPACSYASKKSPRGCGSQRCRRRTAPARSSSPRGRHRRDRRDRPRAQRRGVPRRPDAGGRARPDEARATACSSRRAPARAAASSDEAYAQAGGEIVSAAATSGRAPTSSSR